MGCEFRLFRTVQENITPENLGSHSQLQALSHQLLYSYIFLLTQDSHTFTELKRKK